MDKFVEKWWIKLSLDALTLKGQSGINSVTANRVGMLGHLREVVTKPVSSLQNQDMELKLFSFSLVVS